MLAAAHAIANIIPEEALASDYIVPSVFDQAVVKAVAQAVQDAFEQAWFFRAFLKTVCHAVECHINAVVNKMKTGFFKYLRRHVLPA